MNPIIQGILSFFGGVILAFVILFIMAFIQLFTTRNTTDFTLKYKEDIPGKTFWKRLRNLTKGKTIVEKDSMATCSNYGNVLFYLPSIYRAAKQRNYNELGIITLIFEIDEHEHLHTALFKVGIDGKYHHKIMEKMGIKL